MTPWRQHHILICLPALSRNNNQHSRPRAHRHSFRAFNTNQWCKQYVLVHDVALPARMAHIYLTITSRVERCKLAWVKNSFNWKHSLLLIFIQRSPTPCYLHEKYPDKNAHLVAWRRTNGNNIQRSQQIERRKKWINANARNDALAVAISVYSVVICIEPHCSLHTISWPASIVCVCPTPHTR